MDGDLSDVNEGVLVGGGSVQSIDFDDAISQKIDEHLGFVVRELSIADVSEVDSLECDKSLALARSPLSLYFLQTFKQSSIKG